jgi:hypothetical protein
MKRTALLQSRAMALLLAASTCAPSVSVAGTVVCSATVDYIVVHLPGYVFMKLSSMNSAEIVCRLDVDHSVAGGLYVTTPAMCRSTYAALLAARAVGRQISGAYMDADAAPTACSGFANWTSVSLRSFAFD